MSEISSRSALEPNFATRQTRSTSSEPSSDGHRRGRLLAGLVAGGLAGLISGALLVGNRPDPVATERRELALADGPELRRIRERMPIVQQLDNREELLKVATTLQSAPPQKQAVADLYYRWFQEQPAAVQSELTQLDGLAKIEAVRRRLQERSDHPEQVADRIAVTGEQFAELARVLAAEAGLGLAADAALDDAASYRLAVRSVAELLVDVPQEERLKALSETIRRLNRPILAIAEQGGRWRPPRNVPDQILAPIVLFRSLQVAQQRAERERPIQQSELRDYFAKLPTGRQSRLLDLPPDQFGDALRLEVQFSDDRLSIPSEELIVMLRDLSTRLSEPPGIRSRPPGPGRGNRRPRGEDAPRQFGGPR